MSTPAQIQILDLLEPRLKLIKSANGYSASVLASSVRRRAQVVWNLNTDLPAINYWLGVDRLVEKRYGQVQRSVDIYVEIWSKAADAAPPDLSAQLAADVQAAIDRSPDAPLVSDVADPRLGGTVLSLDVGDILFAQQGDQEQAAGVIITLTVGYKVAIDDPFTLIP